MKDLKSHGWWTVEEKVEHINLLELKAAYYALRCFASNVVSQDIILRVDNTTAIACINKMGSIRYPKFAEVTRLIWQWCERRDIYIFASYIKSSENVVADDQSRIVSTETEWELASFAFIKINREFGPFEVDLFATHVNSKCASFVSWFPDPFAVAVDAFTQDWSTCYFYAFPPFSIITKVLRKIINDQAEGVLVVPWWDTQPWFPVFNKLLVSPILIFDPKPNLLHSPFSSQHPLWRNISLAAGKLSAKLFVERESLSQL